MYDKFVILEFRCFTKQGRGGSTPDQTPGIIQNPFHYMWINILNILKHHEKCPGKKRKLPNFGGGGGGVPTVWYNTKLFPVFSYEGFP